jgi:hypothetical protein
MSGRQFSTHLNNPQIIDALHDGVPEWMRNSLDEWLRAQLADRSYGRQGYADLSLIHQMERLLRTSLGGGNPRHQAMIGIFHFMNSNENLKLDVVEALLQIKGMSYSGTSALETILQQSGSKWKVVRNGTGQYSLQERVEGTVAQAVAEMATRSDDVSEYLTKAWNDAFGRSPNPSSAYGNIIKAVEAASWQVVTPTNSKSTLGTIKRELLDHPERFSVAIAEDRPSTGIESIWRQMAFIWEGQTDRHGTSNPVAPSQGAAEQAIFVGLSLCQQFTRGLIIHV